MEQGAILGERWAEGTLDIGRTGRVVQGGDVLCCYDLSMEVGWQRGTGRGGQWEGREGCVLVSWGVSWGGGVGGECKGCVDGWGM